MCKTDEAVGLDSRFHEDNLVSSFGMTFSAGVIDIGYCQAHVEMESVNIRTLTPILEKANYNHTHDKHCGKYADQRGPEEYDEDENC